MAKPELSTRELEQLLGTRSPITSLQLKDYAIDDVQPKILVEPKTQDEAAKLIATAYRENLPLGITGSGSKLSLGGRPRAVDVIISTWRLERVVEYEPADLTITVESGIRLLDLQKSLAAKGQFIPLDPPYYDRATLGGIVATNASGPRRLMFGSLRDLLLGVRVIESGGTVIKAGGKVVKNVSGYDMRKLFIGSLGTLGLITQMSLKVLPIPEQESTIIGSFSNFEDVRKTVAVLLTSEFIPQAIAVMGVNAPERFRPHKPVEPACVLVTSFCGLRDDVEAQKRLADNLYKRNNAHGISLAEENDHEKVMARVREFPAIGRPVVCKAGVLLSKTIDMIKTIGDIAGKLNLSYDYVAYAGSGIVYIKLAKPEDDAGGWEDYVNAIIALRLEAAKFEGSLVVEKAPVEVKEKVDVWGVSGPTSQLMRAIKSRFDPKGLFNPGRFVEGI